MAETAPTEALANWAKEATTSFVEAQKQWSEIAISQSEELMETVQSGTSLSNPNVIGNVQEATAQGLDTMIKMRMAWLDFAAEQNAQMVKAVKDGMNLDDSNPAAALADFAQATMSSYVEIQKRWLDMATQMPFIGKDKK
jgi:hypothetical protein